MSEQSAKNGAEPVEVEILDPEASATADLAGRTDPAEALRAEIADLKDRLLRAVAETENVRRRSEREKEDAQKYGVTRFARELTSVADNLRRALTSVPEHARAEHDGLKTLLEGVELTERSLLSAFEKAGITRIEPKPGDKADPHRHEVMFEIPGTGQPAGTIVQVVQTGYAIHDRLLCAAQVGVAKAEPSAAHVDTTA